MSARYDVPDRPSRGQPKVAREGDGKEGCGLLLILLGSTLVAVSSWIFWGPAEASFVLGGILLLQGTIMLALYGREVA